MNTPRRTAQFVALGLGAAFAATTHAQDLTIKSPPHRGTTCIYNAAIHPISGPDIPRGFITFTDGKIVEVGAGDPPAAKNLQDQQRIDAKGQHIYPGMIGAYTQIGMTEIQSVAATIDTNETGGITPEVRAATAVNPDSTLIPVTRTNGVLICGVFPTGGTISGQPSVIRLEGWTTGDLTIAPSIGLAVRWPNTRSFFPFWMERPDNDQQQQQQEVDRSLKIITDAFDAAERYAKAKSADPKLPVDLRWEGMRDVVVAGDLKPVTSESASDPALQTQPRAQVFITAGDLDQITSAVAFAGDHHLRIVIVGGRDAALCADLLKQHDIPVIIQGTHRMPRRDDAPYDEAYTLPARLNAAGVKFTICTSDDTAHERNLPYQAAMAVAHGLPMDVALRSVTLTAAEILGIADQAGSLESGKAATLIMTTGNPLEVTTQVQHAYIDGREIDLSNKQTKLAEKYRERYRQMGALKEPEKNGSK